MKTIKAQERFDEPVTPAVLAQAIDRGRQARRPGLHATTVQYLPALSSLLIGFADETAVALPLKNYPELAALETADLHRLEIGFGGNALCLNDRDLHLSIAGLVAASAPLMALAATLIATRNGRRASPAKAEAARTNGLKGGRPRKVATAD